MDCEASNKNSILVNCGLSTFLFCAKEELLLNKKIKSNNRPAIDIFVLIDLLFENLNLEIT